MMKKSILLIAFLFTQLINGQLRKSYSEIHKLYPTAKSDGLRNEGSYIVEYLLVSDEEKKFMIYNKDSIAIGVSFSNKEDINEENYNQIITKEIPNFKTAKTAKTTVGFYYYDTVNDYLIITNQQAEKNKFPIKYFIILIDTFIIKSWIEKINTWE